MDTRRQFVKKLAAATGGIVLLPSITACGGRAAKAVASPGGGVQNVPFTMPQNWDPVIYNLARGNAGAIPKSYHEKINGPQGKTKHIGKHLPYIAQVSERKIPDGYIAIMWGDPHKGHARHPNAPKSEANTTGHWYNWIRVRKAVTPQLNGGADTASELQSAYSNWPVIGPSDNGAYAAFGGSDIMEDGGRNTIYLAALPEGVSTGDTIRIHAHCLTHGEYVDFLTVA